VNFLGTTDDRALELKVNGRRALRLEPTAEDAAHSSIVNVVAGSAANFVAAGVYGATIAGGGAANLTNRVASDFGSIGGGIDNSIQSGTASGIAGGERNVIEGGRSFIGGGVANEIRGVGFWNVINGGAENRIELSSVGATIGGGNANRINSGDSAVIAGGFANRVDGDYATVAGGRGNSAIGEYSFAAGQQAKANHPGAFVWADGSTHVDFASTANNQFLIRASGGVGIGTDSPARNLEVKNSGHVEIGLTSSDSGGRAWTIQSSGDHSTLGGTFQVIDRTAAAARMIISPDGKVGFGRNPTSNELEVEGNASKFTAGSWLANSDARIKTGVQTITNALETLDQVRLVSFCYSPEYLARHPNIEQRRYFNVVAQEFQRVFPEHVTSSGERLSNGDPILQVDTYPLTIYSAVAIQELHRQLRQEESALATSREKVATLENQVIELQKQMAALQAANAQWAARLATLEMTVATTFPQPATPTWTASHNQTEEP
jgi:hypothetical protein